jgi:hypothetical protein
MGLGVPIYSYHSARGGKYQREGSTGVQNTASKDALNLFFKFLSYPLVREIAIDRHNFFPRLDKHIRKIEWRGPDIYEVDIDQRPKLRALMDELGDRGTIVVPSHRHLVGDSLYTRQLLKRLCDSALAPIAVDRVRKYIYPLLSDLQRQEAGGCCPDIEQRIDNALKAITNTAVRVQGTLDHSRRRKGKKKSLLHRKASAESTLKTPKKKRKSLG